MAKPSLCKDFLRASWWTWHFMKRGYNLGLLPGEETITDNLLIYLAHRHKGNLQIYRLKKMEEGEYGADWEWWFHTPRNGTWLGMRVQAKKLNPGNLRYENLGKGQQADNLIDQIYEPLDKFIRDATWKFMVPVYVFYNYWCVETACKKRPYTGMTNGYYAVKVYFLGAPLIRAKVIRQGAPWPVPARFAS